MQIATGRELFTPDAYYSDGRRFIILVRRKTQRLFEVPIALITFIDRDHQWFKSQVGLPEEIAEAQQTSRELSVCGHVVANDELLVVEDLSRDRRFANNPLLKERSLRFYAGVPLRSNSLPIGSLCILDVKPRPMTEREKRLLEVHRRRCDGGN